MSTTYYEANRLLEQAFGATDYSAPGILYFGLSTATLNATGAITGEVTGGSYARATITNTSPANWGAAASGSLSNVATVTFPESTASWGNILSVFIVDAASAGNMMYFASLTPSRTVATGTTLLFAAGAIVCSMT